MEFFSWHRARTRQGTENRGDLTRVRRGTRRAVRPYEGWSSRLKPVELGREEHFEGQS